MKTWIEYQQQEQIMQFLMGLNESFTGIRGQILMLDPFPSISKVYNLVAQEERQRTISSEGRTEPMTFATAPGSTVAAAQGRSRSRPVCSHCGLTGHVVDRCYKLHGFPPGLKPKPKPKPKAQSGPQQNDA